MNANEREWVEGELTYKIVGCAIAVLNYLRITGLEAGLILNFKHATLEWKKVVLQEGRCKWLLFLIICVYLRLERRPS